jgi:hypothetical protein
MTDSEIRELISDARFDGQQAEVVFLLCRDVERRTRQEYFSLIQNANNAASSRSITARELNRFVWDTEQKANQ